MKWFRVDRSTGIVVGVSDMSAALLERNLGPDQVALDWRPDVNPTTDRWDFDALAWVARTDEEPAVDYRVARYHAYPQMTDQVGALMKLAATLVAVLDPADIPAEVRAEISVLAEEIASVKEENPKPST